MLQAFDYETTGFNPRRCKVFGYVITDEAGASEVFDLDYPGRRGVMAEKRLKEFFANPRIEKIAHNLKFELHFTLRQLGIKPHPETVWHDTMIMSQIHNNLEFQHSLDFLANLHCPDQQLKAFWKDIDKQVKTQAKARGDRYDRVDRKLMHTYQENDGFRTMLLYKFFEEYVQPYWKNYRNEIAVITATQRMEDFGLFPSVPAIKKMQKWLTSELDKLETPLFFLQNAIQNWNSDDVVRDYLYKTKKFPILAYTETKKPATDKDVFIALRDQFPQAKEELDLILKTRSYLKGMSTMENYLEHIDSSDGVIHHSINTNSARTGRQTAKEPNMQNVAKETALKNLFPVPARKCFVPRPKSILGFVDYSGIEMRLIIEAVKEPTMIEVLKAEGDDPLDPRYDIHALASSYWFGDMFLDQKTCLKDYLPLNEELSAQYKELVKTMGKAEAEESMFYSCRKVLRGGGKNGQFALAYGGTFDAILATLRMPRDLVLKGYQAYCERFPLIANFTRDSMSMAKRDGFVTTSFGRRLYIERDRVHTASNYRIQGTAAEMLKKSTVLLDNYLIKHFPDVRLIVPIHDELMLHIPDKYIPNLPQLTEDWGKTMTVFPELAVPIEVEWEFSELSWNDKTSYAKMLKRMEAN